MAQAPSTTADALASQRETATAMETSSTPSATAEAIAQPTPTTMASATTLTSALVSLTTAGFATDLAPFMNVDAPTSLLSTVTAMETSSTLWVFAAGRAQQTSTKMESVTT